MERDLDQHITILGWLHIAGSLLFLCVGVFVFVFFAGLGVAAEDPEAVRVLGVVGLSVGLFLVLLGLPGLVAGYGLLQRKPWARMLAIVLGVLNLANVPVGTIVGAYTLWILLDEDAVHHFAGRQMA